MGQTRCLLALKRQCQVVGKTLNVETWKNKSMVTCIVNILLCSIQYFATRPTYLWNIYSWFQAFTSRSYSEQLTRGELISLSLRQSQMSYSALSSCSTNHLKAALISCPQSCFFIFRHFPFIWTVWPHLHLTDMRPVSVMWMRKNEVYNLSCHTQ